MKTGILQAKAERDANGKIVSIDGAPDEMVKELSQLELSTPGTFDWSSLPYTQFGSGKNKSGKYAKEGTLLFILRKGSVLPIVVKTGPSAMKGIRQSLTRTEYPYWQCVVGLTLTAEDGKGVDPVSGRPVTVKYSLAKLNVKSVLSDEDADKVEQKYTLLLKKDWESGMIEQAVSAE
jgi:hypothetical protein